MSFADKIKQHWLVGIIMLFAAFTAVVWAVFDQILVRPRDFRIEDQRERIAGLERSVAGSQQEGIRLGLQTAIVLQSTKEALAPQQPILSQSAQVVTITQVVTPTPGPTSLPTEIPPTQTARVVEVTRIIEVTPTANPVAAPPAATEAPNPAAQAVKLDIDTASASSSWSPQFPANMIDGNEMWCWRSKTGAAGSEVTFILAEPKTITGIRIRNGHPYVSRAKDATIQIEQSPQDVTQDVTFENVASWQTREIGPVMAKSVTIKVHSAYPGDSIERLEICEVELIGYP